MKHLFLLPAFLLFCHTIVFSQGCLPEGITFTTQEEIDNFQSYYPGCTEIEGDVTIWGNMTNLNGLSGLTTIGGYLFIFANNNLNSLTGLQGLTSIGSYLKITHNDGLINLTGLDGLTSIGSNLSIMYCDALMNLAGLEGLTFIGGYLHIAYNNSLSSLTGIDNIQAGSITYLDIVYNPILADCDVYSICIYLSTPYAQFAIGNNSPGCYNELEILEACGITSCLPEGITFTTQSQIDNFPYIYPWCTEIEGSVVISGDNITNLDGLSQITLIDDSLSLINNILLSNLNGLQNLTSCGYLKILDNDNVYNLNGINNIISIGGSLFIGGNDWLSYCNVESICNYLNSPNGTVDIYYNYYGCNSQAEVEAACLTSIEENPAIEGLSISPNPASSFITIHIKEGIAIEEAIIYNHLGQKALVAVPVYNTVDVSGLTPGIYFLEVVTSERRAGTKLVVE